MAFDGRFRGEHGLEADVVHVDVSPRARGVVGDADEVAARAIEGADVPPLAAEDLAAEASLPVNAGRQGEAFAAGGEQLDLEGLLVLTAANEEADELRSGGDVEEG
jgi:hypothetical protein